MRHHSGLIVVSEQAKCLGTPPARLVRNNQSITASFYSNNKRVFSVSLVELCNSRVSDRHIPSIHHGLICRIRPKSTWNTTIATS
jgi:hypothetical protein